MRLSGVTEGMNSPNDRWHVTRSNPVRADAGGWFIPVDDLAGASVGDVVVVSGPEGKDSRTGVIAELTDGPERPFFRLDLDQ